MPQSKFVLGKIYQSVVERGLGSVWLEAYCNGPNVVLGEQQQDWKGGSKLKNPGQDWGQSRMIPRCTSE